MLVIKNLHAEVSGKKILKGLSLEVKPGEIHAIMGPNGSGKSTLSAVLTGNENYIVTEGEIYYEGKNLFDLNVEERAKAGIFLSFQYPVEIPGVSMINFMKTAVNEQRKFKNLPPLSSGEFLKYMREMKDLVELKSDLANRSVN
ncbi:MAG: ATP-binding cassette domain-containing protein, partial [Bacteroidota bacterium]|nr:ATP-binding cassette domain-containing protein [Bacteroidota bacterium]